MLHSIRRVRVITGVAKVAPVRCVATVAPHFRGQTANQPEIIGKPTKNTEDVSGCAE
jgi:hypothetical protein